MKDCKSFQRINGRSNGLFVNKYFLVFARFIWSTVSLKRKPNICSKFRRKYWTVFLLISTLNKIIFSNNICLYVYFYYFRWTFKFLSALHFFGNVNILKKNSINIYPVWYCFQVTTVLLSYISITLITSWDN